MNASKLATASIDDIVAEYVEAAAKHHEATDAGTSRVTNRAHDRIASAYGELRRRGPDAQRSLLPLLDHENLGVRLWAAAHALEFAPAEGERTLLELEPLPGFTGFNAGMTLQVWRKGELRFP
jgi:Domain of unknown function (DUF2019)